MAFLNSFIYFSISTDYEDCSYKKSINQSINQSVNQSKLILDKRNRYNQI